MCDMAIDLDTVGQRWQVDAADYFASALERLEIAERDGLLTRQGLRLTATPVGRLLIRHLAMAFDTHLQRQDGQRYSKIV
jgi:oxygen-independent coproporphyrinogen-3 oxidase